MGDIGVPELIIFLVIIIVLVGPGRLAGAVTALGKSIRGFRQAIRRNGARPSRDEPSPE